MKAVPHHKADVPFRSDRDVPDARDMLKRLSRAGGPSAHGQSWRGGTGTEMRSSFVSKSTRLLTPRVRGGADRRPVSAHPATGSAPDMPGEPRLSTPRTDRPRTCNYLTQGPGARGQGIMHISVEGTQEAVQRPSWPSQLPPDLNSLTRHVEKGSQLAFLIENIIEVRQAMGDRLDKYPQFRAELDYDLKELQLHLDRLMLQASCSKARHEAQLDAMRQDYLVKMRMLREDHEAMLRERDEQLAQLEKHHMEALEEAKRQLDETKRQGENLVREVTTELDLKCKKTVEECEAHLKTLAQAKDEEKEEAIRQTRAELESHNKQENSFAIRAEATIYEEKLSEYKAKTQGMVKQLQTELQDGKTAQKELKQATKTALKALQDKVSEVFKRVPVPDEASAAVMQAIERCLGGEC